MRAWLTAIFLSIAGPVAAADQATLHQALFSPDGRYFGFIEYGQWDASGHPYGAFALIDTAADAWVKGTPIHVEIPDPDLDRPDGLKAIQAKAAPFVREYRLTDPGNQGARFDNPNQPTGAAQSARFRLTAPGDAEVILEQRPAVSAHGCSEDWNEPVDFQLTLVAGGQRQVLSPFKGRLPKSRGCAHGYGIARVLTHASASGLVLAVILDVYTPGWEWFDRRHMAITTRLR